MAAPYIVIIEDNNAVRALIGDVLKDDGHKVALCATSDEAYSWVRKKPPILVILDFHLDEELSGGELVQALRLEAAMAGVPIILCSADKQALDDTRIQYQLHLHVLEKPFNIGELLATVDKAIERRL
jgi:DNA-binding response OmpR family regulator